MSAPTAAAIETPRPRRRRRAGLVLGATVLLGSVGAGAAYAFWSATGSGTGEAQAATAAPFTIVNATSSPDLFPGGTGVLNLTVTNPNAYAVSFAGISSIDAAGVTSNKTGCTATLAALTLDSTKTRLTTPEALAGGASKTYGFTGALTMANLPTNQDPCQGAVFTIPVTAAQASS